MLEIGTGCGYQAAVLSHVAREVYSIERLRELHEKARAFILKAAGNADSERFASENLAMKEEIARLSSMVKELSARDKSNNKVAA